MWKIIAILNDVQVLFNCLLISVVLETQSDARNSNMSMLICSRFSAFKAHHSGTTFYFAAERQDDMAK